MSAEIKLSTVTITIGGAILSIGLGIFLWRLTLRVDQLFALGLPFAASLVFVGALAYGGLCYYLLASYLAANSSPRRNSTYQPLLREANVDLAIERARAAYRRPPSQKRPSGRA